MLVRNTAGWLGVLLLGYLTTRGLCLFQIPEDCKTPGNFWSLGILVVLGVIQGHITGVINDVRFQKFPWLTIYLFSIPVFSLLSQIPIFNRSIVSDSEISPDMQIGLCFIISAVGISILFHIWLTLRMFTFRDFCIFWTWRCAAAGCVIGGYVIARMGVGWRYRVHLHHYFVAWAISLLSAVEHRISDALLAVSCAIFVQGLAAYSADPILIPGNF